MDLRVYFKSRNCFHINGDILEVQLKCIHQDSNFFYHTDKLGIFFLGIDE